MKVLVLHNYYQQPGGEDVVVSRERELLEAHGHDVRLYSVSNETVRDKWDTVRTAWQTIYSWSARRHVADQITRFRPDLVHVHNFFPLLTPSVYDACRAASVPVVQSLHNYRLVCVNTQFLRNGRICELCLGKLAPWPGVLHACWRSRGASGTVAAMVAVHRVLRTWTEKVDVYVALTDFARGKFIRAGLPAQKIVVKPNFVHPDPGIGDSRGGYALFAGRLVPEKGVATLLAAVERLGGRIPLKIAGEGPLADQVRAAARRIPGLEWVGHQPPERVLALMKDARALVVASIHYDSFALVVAEAYSVGLPVVASHLGSLPSLVEDGRTGLLFRPGDPDDLAAKLTWLWTHPREREEMRRGARQQFEINFSGARNYEMMMAVYARATAHSRKN
jgi:glycosyltransferase involved in cell wall biosynthesis